MNAGCIHEEDNAASVVTSGAELGSTGGSRVTGSPHLSGEQSLEVGWTADAETRAAKEGDALTYVDFTFP